MKPKDRKTILKAMSLMGSIKTKRKSEAARINGLKGGRPAGKTDKNKSTKPLDITKQMG